MTVQDLSKELLKIKGREPLPQNYPNHINNMASETRDDSSFKSKPLVFRTTVQVHYIFACFLESLFV